MSLALHGATGWGGARVNDWLAAGSCALVGEVEMPHNIIDCQTEWKKPFDGSKHGCGCRRADVVRVV